MQKAGTITFSLLLLPFLITESSGFQAEQHGSRPTILGASSPPIVYTEFGKPARLNCTYHTETDAKVNWMRDGIEVRHDCDTCISSVKTDRKTSFLEITTYINEDFGDYECRVRNKYGSTKMKISLRKIDVKKTKCEKQRLLSSDPRKKYEFRPVCNEDGSYHEVQCSIEHDKCWCVNKYGKKTLDVIDGANGLHCFTPKDLSVLAIFVLTQGIFVTLVLIDQIFHTYTDYSVYGNLKRYLDQRLMKHRKGYKVLKKNMDGASMKSRPLPAVPGHEPKRKRKQ